MSVAIIYGSSTGNTKDAAEAIAEEFGDGVDVLDVADIEPSKLNDYDKLILGTSTWGSGELQDDWDAFDWSDVDLTGKTVALFGLGDQESYSDEFCDALIHLYESAKEKGATVVGYCSTDGYDFEESQAVNGDGNFIGLALDHDNEEDLSPERIKNWVESIRGDFE